MSSFSSTASSASASSSSSSSTSPSQYSKNQMCSDRFVPLRQISKESQEFARHQVFSTLSSRLNEEEPHLRNDTYCKAIKEALFGDIKVGSAGKPKVLQHCKTLHPARSERMRFKDEFKIGHREYGAMPKVRLPEMIVSLDGPNLCCDFYSNLVDWSFKNDWVAVALGDEAYMWNFKTHETVLVRGTLQDDGNGEPWTITGVKWVKEGRCLALSFMHGLLEIWDVERCQRIYCSKSLGTSRVAALSTLNPHTSSLYYGNADGEIKFIDPRSPKAHVGVIYGHSQEVCVLTADGAGTQLASGSNDNTVGIWDLRTSTSSSRSPIRPGGRREPGLVHRLEGHIAAVKAVAWNPSVSSILATGGGTADRTLKVWNINSGAHPRASLNIGSQVSGVHWLDTDHLISTHGFSTNTIEVTRYDHANRIMRTECALVGHTERIICSAICPQKKSMITAAGDEMLKIWDVSEVVPKRKALCNPKALPKAKPGLEYYTVR